MTAATGKNMLIAQTARPGTKKTGSNTASDRRRPLGNIPSTIRQTMSSVIHNPNIEYKNNNEYVKIKIFHR